MILTVLIGAIAGQARAATPTGAQIARQIVATWNCQDQLSQPRTPARNPWNLKRHTPAFKAWLLNAWKLRHSDCLEELAALRRQWNWRKWLPANWYAVARCETGVNWRHANSRFVSAFGISRREYDADAAYMGAPPWNDARPPSPWHQYLAALGHYRRFGDGWSCPGP